MRWAMVVIAGLALMGCDDDPGQELSAEECQDGLDNDGDGTIDCEDQDCSMTIDAGTYEYCCVCGEDVDSCICFSDHDDYDYDERMTDE